MARDLELIVLKDAEGEYYALPRASLEQARVPQQYRAELERMIAEAAAADTGGRELSMQQLDAVAGGASSLTTTTLHVSSDSGVIEADTWIAVGRDQVTSKTS